MFLLTSKFNLCFVHISQYLLQFLLNIYCCAKRLHIISNALFRLLAFKDKYNKNKLLILDKINNLATNIQIVTKLMRYTCKKKLNSIN